MLLGVRDRVLSQVQRLATGWSPCSTESLTRRAPPEEGLVRFHGSLLGSGVQRPSTSVSGPRQVGAPWSMSSCFDTVTNVDFNADALKCSSLFHTLGQPTAFRDGDLHNGRLFQSQSR